jgi:hypothetical protein
MVLDHSQNFGTFRIINPECAKDRIQLHAPIAGTVVNCRSAREQSGLIVRRRRLYNDGQDRTRDEWDQCL